MVKKSFLLFIFLVSVFSTSGCSTLVKGTGGLVLGTKEGAADDWRSIKKTDAWVKENLW